MVTFSCLEVRKYTLDLLIVLSLGFTLAGWISQPQTAFAAEAVTNGYRDFTFPSVGSGNNDNEVTGEKAESKLWWNDGYWWASMLKSGSTSYHIFRLNMATQDWEDTGVVLDDRLLSRADVLWDGANNKLYVVSHIFAFTAAAAPAGQRGELFRYSYNTTSDTYTLDAGFPVEVNQAKTEALVLAKDSTGALWVTYVESGKVMVNHSLNNNDASWGTPYVLPVGTLATVDPSDMSSIIAYNGRIGVMWSNQASSKKMYFAVHVDGAGDAAADWTSLAAYTPSGDDHLNLKTLQSDGEGHLYAVIKTSFQLNANPEKPWIVLVACKVFPCTNANNWIPYTVWTTSDKSPTRPQLLIDTENRDLYIFSRIIYDLKNNKKGIYYKSSDLDNISFATGDGKAFITSDSEKNTNNPTTTKQNVNRTTGLVVLASDPSARYYLHNCLTLVSPDVTCGPNAPASVGFSGNSYSVNENSALATITVTLNHATNKVVAVNYATSNGTASAGSDYSSNSGSLSFAIGEMSKTFSVPILNDNLDETTETISLTLSGPTNANLGMPSTASLTITDDEITPTMQIESVGLAVIENVTGGSAPVTLTLSGPSAQVVQATFATANGTATANVDFAPITSTVIFSPGQTSQVLLLPILNDTLDEEDETINLLLSNAGHALLSTPNSVLTILDNDVLPAVELITGTLRLAENANTVALSVTLSVPSGRVVTVHYATAPGTAAAGSDYTAANDLLTFMPDETSKSLLITLLDDNVDESEETFTVVLNTPTNAGLGNPGSTLVGIIDDDITPRVDFSAATFQTNESDETGTVTVKLNTPASKVVSVGYTINNGTATNGQDYQGNTVGAVTFNPGESSKSFAISVNNDTIDEDGETIKLTLNNPSQDLQLGAITSTTLLIEDNDNPPLAQLASASVSINENDSSGQAVLHIQLSAASGKPISVTYTVGTGTATEGSDYQVANGLVRFSPGETDKTVIIKLIDDRLREDNETLSLQLNSATNANVGAIQSTLVTIVDEDGQALVYFGSSIFREDENVVGGFAIVTVTLSLPAPQQLTIDYSTGDDNASAISDYAATSGTLTFAPGDLVKTIGIQIINDSQVEENENVRLHLFNPQNVAVGAVATTTLTIVDDDGGPRVRFQNSTYSIREDEGIATVFVSLSTATSVTTTIPISVGNGSALVESDYHVTSNVLTFAPGQITQSFTLTIVDDHVAENAETVLLSLPDESVVALGSLASATLTIVDNDQLFGNNLYLPALFR